jgi:hypothetical protein
LKNLDLITEENQPIKKSSTLDFRNCKGVYELCEKIELNGLNIELHLFGDYAEKSNSFDFNRKR